jgi:hypothetical protein
VNSDFENRKDRNWFRVRLGIVMPGLNDAWADVKASRVQLEKEKWTRLAVSVTDVLTLVDRALSQGEARAGMPPEELGRFRLLFERAIYEVLLHETDQAKGEPKGMLKKFSDWLHAQGGPVGVITSNYDTAVDRQIFKSVWANAKLESEDAIAEAVDMGFAWRRVDSDELSGRPSAPRWQLLKVHGSVNWLHCPLCGQIYMNVQGAIGTQAFRQGLSPFNTCICNPETIRLRLHLVTPSLVRQTHDAHLLGIMQASLELLRKAERWFIVGYSLPPEDVAIRSLFLRAWDASLVKPHITVVQRANVETENVYRAFFPRANLTYRTDGLEGFLAPPNLAEGGDGAAR